MKLNTDDTLIEQYVNSMHRESDVMLNCEKCGRLFYRNADIARKEFDAHISLLCPRCRRK